MQCKRLRGKKNCHCLNCYTDYYHREIARCEARRDVAKLECVRQHWEREISVWRQRLALRTAYGPESREKRVSETDVAVPAVWNEVLDYIDLDWMDDFA